MNASYGRNMAEFLRHNEEASLLRVATAGSVDDGKSTLIGRLLFETKNIFEDTLASLKDKKSGSSDAGEFDLSLLTDGLKAEREQKITIDVAYRYFSTPKRKIILADTPGHEQYTRNMATGASTADAAIVLVDAQKGILPQTKRHSFILSLLGVRHIIVAINKMDAVGYSAETFDRIRADYIQFSAKLDLPDVHFIPISALRGDNISKRSPHMEWYQGETILGYLEDLYIEGDRNLISFRYPIQTVIRPDQYFRGFAGQIASGIVRKGDEILALPSMQRSRVKTVHTFDGELEEAYAPMSITLTLEDEIDLSRGDMLVRPHNLPQIGNDVETMLVWLHEKPMDRATIYYIKHTTHLTRARIGDLRYRTDVSTLARSEASTLQLNEIGRVSLKTNEALFYDPYSSNRASGNFILIDPVTNDTVAAGMILGQISAGSIIRKNEGAHSQKNVVLEESMIDRATRETRNNHRGATIWMTGLSGSGKSSIAKVLERKLFDSNYQVYNLDGDNVRHGLNHDLGFSAKDRRENIRRVAEVCRLMNDAGLVTIAALISPLIEDRKMAKSIVGDDSFVEIFVDAPLEVCEQRDPKGLYKKARRGEIDQFTGISAPYQAPPSCDLRIPSNELTAEAAADQILQMLQNKLEITK